MSEFFYPIWCFYLLVGFLWFISMMIYVTVKRKRIKQGFLILCVFGWIFSLGGWVYFKLTQKSNPFDPFALIVDE